LWLIDDDGKDGRSGECVRRWDEGRGASSLPMSVYSCLDRYKRSKERKGGEEKREKREK
jgi:hypothetical protein